MSSRIFSSDFLNDYMEMVANTESPRQFHLWTALSAVSCALGRRCWFPFGDGEIFPNQFILLVGTPGTRKTTAQKIGYKLLKKGTGVRFAPQDTHGQRQGLIEVMRQTREEEHMMLDGVELAQADDSLAALTMQQFASIQMPSAEELELSHPDRHTLVVHSGEFSRFIGQGNQQMLDFLTGMWDGQDYDYKTKTSSAKLESPLINLMGCTTPVSIATSMPSQADGQGFLSRMILVFGPGKEQWIARPTPFNDDLRAKCVDHLSRVFKEMSGPFHETPEAKALSVKLYEQPSQISDGRFGYYLERRYDHLIKLSMCLAACRLSNVINESDVFEANAILSSTELFMHDALGEFGLSPLAAIKQSVMEYMRVCYTMPYDSLRIYFHRDANAQDFKEAINDLVNAKQLRFSQSKQGSGELYVSLASIAKANETNMWKSLASKLKGKTYDTDSE